MEVSVCSLTSTLPSNQVVTQNNFHNPSSARPVRTLVFQGDVIVQLKIRFLMLGYFHSLKATINVIEPRFDCGWESLLLVTLPSVCLHCELLTKNKFTVCLFPVCGQRLRGGLVPEARGGGGGFLRHHLRHARGDQRRPRQSPETRRPEEDLQSGKNAGMLPFTLHGQNTRTHSPFSPVSHIVVFLF